MDGAGLARTQTGTAGEALDEKAAPGRPDPAPRAAGPTGPLELKHIWTAPGYRHLTLTFVNPTTKAEYDVNIVAADLQRLINSCADATRQIGIHGPIDWDLHPTQIYWPAVTPWKAGPRKS